MKPLGFPLLADENIQRDVILELIEQGKDICSIYDEDLTGASDLEVLRRAHSLGRVLLTHDSDFGALAIQAGEPVIGIIYIRPGHIEPSFVLETISAIEARDFDVQPPFIVVAERRQDIVRIRIRPVE